MIPSRQRACILASLIFTLTACIGFSSSETVYMENVENEKEPLVPPTDGWDFPVGAPDAEGYYNAQPFGKILHLGEDWNGKGGGNTDFGDPIYAAANGWVKMAEDIHGGWGNVILLYHLEPDGRRLTTLYAHCDSIWVEPETVVTRGQQIGTIGDADGAYYAHLHFELRWDWDSLVGAGYGDPIRHIKPSDYIKANRPIH